tara:strand:- start:358 stop:843 length:486 start_codon:yes stop_codon:yes gene_type:complete
MIVLLYQPKGNDAFVALAREQAGRQWPGLTLHMRTAEMWKESEMEPEDVEGVVYPSTRPQIGVAYGALDIALMEIVPPARPEDVPMTKASPAPPPEGVDDVVIADMVGLSVKALSDMLPSIASTAFLEALYDAEYGKGTKARSTALNAIKDRREWLEMDHG